MSYNFLEDSVDIENIVLPDSDKINPFLLKNHYTEIIKAVDFLNSKDTFLYVHGFMGTGKRQFINYITEFLNKDVIKLEYYCKSSTVCDDILLHFINTIENYKISKTANINIKITTLAVKFQQYISSLQKPFVLILHSFDDISDENKELVKTCFTAAARLENTKIIVSTRAMVQDVLGELKVERKIFLKAFSKEIFKDYIDSNKMEYNSKLLEDFYKYTRGYYYYTALCIKIIQAMRLTLQEFLEKFILSGLNFDEFIGSTYINLLPNTIRNFFWFLRTIRHGISINALASLELYDEFSIQYLKSNLMAFQVDEVLYVQDYFQQDIDISIPEKTEIKLHKYIVGIYEKELKEPLQTRTIMLSRQALRAEIDYHNACIQKLQNNDTETTVEKQEKGQNEHQEVHKEKELPATLEAKISEAKKLTSENKNTDAIECYKKILEEETIDKETLTDIRLSLARLYKAIGDYKSSQHYFELVETYYKQNNEFINLNYLYYELTDLYFVMYKNERAIETIEKVIYSVDTPQSLMVSASTLLGNIYYDMNKPEEAYKYYQKALESLDENTSEDTLAELYFKYALALDDKEDTNSAFEYYTKCISLPSPSPYKALSYSNLGACYYDNNNFSDAKDCFAKAYEIEKSNNNYDGIYYNAMYLAKIFLKENSDKALSYFIEAQQSAEFLNEDFYMLESSVALGDYYYNDISKNKEALKEYFKAKKIAENMGNTVDITKINERIDDMKLRMDEESFSEIQNKYE